MILVYYWFSLAANRTKIIQMAKRLKRIDLEIYIICDGNGWTKIGYSANVKQRLRDLQAANPFAFKSNGK